MRYVKPHGALYHRMADDEACASAVADALARRGDLVLLVPAGSRAVGVAASRGTAVATEAFADRAYRPDGRLVDRAAPGAVLTDRRGGAARQALDIAVDHRVTAVDGSVIDMAASSICVHGDTPGAVAVARHVRDALAEAGVTLRSLRAVTALRPVRWFGDGALVADVDTVADAHVRWPPPSAAAIDRRRGRRGRVPLGHRRGRPGRRATCALADEPRAGTRRRGGHRAAGTPGPRHTVGWRSPCASTVPTSTRWRRRRSMTSRRRRAALLGAELTVAFVGFPPGFRLSRRPPRRLGGRTPAAPPPHARCRRVRWPSGADSPAIYPQASPGGWNLVGRSAMALFDPDTRRSRPWPPGTRCGCAPWPRSAPVPTRTRAAAAVGRAASCRRRRARAAVDGAGPGRVGVARPGRARAPVAPTPRRCAPANRLVGNADGDAALEITASGPRLRFHQDVHVAVVGGAEMHVDGRPVDVDTVVPVASGQELSVGATREHLRCYVAVSGGFEVEPVFGSRSSDVLTGLGPGPLRAGDVLGLGPPTRPRGRFDPAVVAHRLPGVVRVMAGPDALDTGAVEALAGEAWQVGPASDRMGVRLHRPGAPPAAGPAIASRGMVTGAVQLPPDGLPVVLLCDHATVGGYPVVATVVRSDLGRAGAAPAGRLGAFRPR